MKKIVLLVFVSVFLLLATLSLIKESTSFSEATIYVDSSTNGVSVGNTFVINVSVADVAELSGFGFTLGYNTTFLDALGVWVPPPFETPIRPLITDPDGTVHVTATSTIPLSGSGTLASITFNATAVGSSILDLYDTVLSNSAGNPIPHTIIDGSATVSSVIITVPDDYQTIQKAINAASDGDTIFVRADTYYERVVVNKSISLVGEDRSTTIIDGNVVGTVMNVTASNVNITGFTIQMSGETLSDSGIYVSSSGNNISYNIITYNWAGIRLYSSFNNIISGNNITMNFYLGLQLDSSSNNTICGNTIENNGIGTVLSSSNNNTILGNHITNNKYYGVGLGSSSNNTISYNNITANKDYGVIIYLSSNNTISENKITNSEYEGGIYLRYSSNNSICRNNITANNPYGILLDKSSYNTISGNIITNNVEDISLSFSSNNTIIGNNVTNNQDGIILWDFSEFNNISRNNMANNGYGILLRRSSSNFIYHNNFTDNARQVGILMSGYANSWDDGSGKGNYWNDYEERYPNATEIDGSGIWDTPYEIGENNVDNYPIVPEFPTWTSMLLILILLTFVIVMYKRRLHKRPFH